MLCLAVSKDMATAGEARLLGKGVVSLAFVVGVDLSAGPLAWCRSSDSGLAGCRC